MFEDINKQEALEFITKKMKSEKAFEGVEEKDILTIGKQAMDLDFEYMEKNKVFEGEVYDEDDAYDYMYEKLSAGLDDENKALVSLIIDGYLQYWDEYLEENDLIDWE